MFPVTKKFIFVPFSVVALIVSGFEVGVGVGEVSGPGVGEAVEVGVGVDPESAAKTAEILVSL